MIEQAISGLTQQPPVNLQQVLAFITHADVDNIYAIEIWLAETKQWNQKTAN